MPEYPEVGQVVKKLNESVKGKEIKRVDVLFDRIVRVPEKEAFLFQIQEQTIREVTQRGKHIIFHLTNYVLISHLRMEGKYEYVEPIKKTNKSLNKHDHVIFYFSDGTELRYNDVRKFGTLDLVTNMNDVKGVAELGLEPLSSDLTVDYLVGVLKNKKMNIKKALLDQRIVAGIGNIYADEILFDAGVHPEVMCSDLTKKQFEKLVDSTQGILALAIEKGGSSIRTYDSMGEKGSMQELHKVYGKEGKPCVNCASEIRKMKLGGRGTHFCPTCQKS